MAMIALDIALLVAAAFDAVGCEYFLGGSVASSLQGEPRATNDIDFVVAMPRFRVRAFAEKLGSDFEIDQDMLRDALDRGGCANIFYLPAVTKVDIFGLGSAPYDEAEFGRRHRMRVRSTGEELFVKSPEARASMPTVGPRRTIAPTLPWHRCARRSASHTAPPRTRSRTVTGSTMAEIVLDTNVLAALLYADDVRHQRARALVVRLEADGHVIVALDFRSPGSAAPMSWCKTTPSTGAISPRSSSWSSQGTWHLQTCPATWRHGDEGGEATGAAEQGNAADGARGSAPQKL